MISRRMLQLVLLSLLFLVPSCGDNIPGTAGSITFTPSGVDLETSTIGVSRQKVTFNIADSDGNPIQDIEYRIMTYLHDKLPQAGAAGVIAFTDENGNPLNIASPDSSSDQNNVIEGTTNNLGNGEFFYQFPTGGNDYEFSIFVLAARAIGTFTQTVSGPSS